MASDLKRSLKRLGIHPELVRRAAIATYEAEMNVILYAEEGRVDVLLEPELIRIEVRDRGQGIANVDQAMEPGFSTAPGLGAGAGLRGRHGPAQHQELCPGLRHPFEGRLRERP